MDLERQMNFSLPIKSQQFHQSCIGSPPGQRKLGVIRVGQSLIMLGLVSLVTM